MSELDAELRALCDKYRQFATEERSADRAWLTARVDSGKLDGTPIAKFKDHIVAVYRKQVVLVGDDETAMRVELSKKYEVHPGRFVLLLVEESSIPRKRIVLGLSAVGVAVVLVLCAVLGIAAVTSLGTKASFTFSKIGSSVGTPTAR